MSAYLPSRSFAVRGINAAGRALRAVGLRPVKLDDSSLLAAASQRTGLDDWGDEAFLTPLRLLLADYEAESRLTLTGRILARQAVLRTLESRLQLIAARKRHPEMEEEAIRRPIFIVGLPRTGSSILHELLALDPESRAPLTWEVMWPMPFPEAAHAQDDPRIAKAARQLQGVDQLIPGFRKMHRMGALLPQECCMLMNHDFMSMQWNCSNRVPTYQKWFDAQEMRPTYASHRRQLQHFQFRWPADRWVLKSPQHLWSLDALLDVYPDARIVQTHRDPVKVAASLASLVALLRGMATDDIDPHEVGSDWAAQLGVGLERAMDVRSRPGVDDGRFFDVHFRTFMRDPIATVRAIYDRFGLSLGELAEERMRRYLVAHPQDAHGRHEYTLSGAGLDLERERSRFARYERDYRIEPELA